MRALVDAAVALGESLPGPETAVLGRLNTTEITHARHSLAAGGKTDSKPHENSPYKMSGWYFQSW